MADQQMISVAPGAHWRELYVRESDAVRRRFFASGKGLACTQERAALVDEIVCALFNLHLQRSDARGICMVALGGYGRGTLFPHSDVDLMFLGADDEAEASAKQAVADISRELWDMRIRVSPFTRTLAECGKPDPANLEFTIALLDARFVCGARDPFTELQTKVMPRVLQRDRAEIIRDLVGLTRKRHKKFSDTVFHLEPNIKDGPGGLRDLNVAHWLTLTTTQAPHAGSSTASADQLAPALEFLAATRCFLHYRSGRDDNQLTYERQAEAADESIGARPMAAFRSADWMRLYFRHARMIDRQLARLLDGAPLSTSTLYSRFEQWRSRLSNADYSVVNGRVFVRQPSALSNSSAVLGLFEFLARHGLKLSAEAERQVQLALTTKASVNVSGSELWEQFARILVQPAAARALRAMHELGVLRIVLPEFEAIDSLVVGDYYHRYTVDEHSFTAIELLHGLQSREVDAKGAFREILAEVERQDLLHLALLLHDIGKAVPGDHHVQGSLAACERVCSRFALSACDRDTLRFLIANHLEMSATVLRRDIFDPNTIRTFAARVGTIERLKMLCLLTYADIGAVSPETLTPWKAESLWQLYAATANHILRNVDAERVQSDTGERAVEQQIAGEVPEVDTASAREFLRGMPRRYVLLHSPQEIAEHCQMASRLSHSTAQVSLRGNQRSYKLTVITPDRPRLFAALAGLLACWRMNIQKVDAFANAQGVVVDTFQFTDTFGTLAMNSFEVERFQRELQDMLGQEITADTLRWLGERGRTRTTPPTKVEVPTRVWFDESSSAHSTIVEIVARDRPGLLYDIAAALAELEYNIDIALIDTEGQKAIDVLYTTHNGQKLTRASQHHLREILLARL